MAFCNNCGKEVSAEASTCVHCGHPLAGGKKPVGFLLGFGIFILPIVFAWFTCQRGRSTTSRVVAFSWLAVNVLIGLADVGNPGSGVVG